MAAISRSDGKEPGRGSSSRVPDDIAAAKRAEVFSMLDDPSVNQAVVDRLWMLHWDYGYFTRAEIEAALGLDAP